MTERSQRIAWFTSVALAVAAAAGFSLAFSRPGERLAGSNAKVAVSRVSLSLAPGELRCQGGENIPADAGSIRMFAGVPGGGPGPRVAIAFLDSAGKTVASAEIPPGYGNEPVRVGIPPPDRDVRGAQACFRNLGETPVAFAGNLTPLSHGAVVGPNNPGARDGDEIRIDYFREGRQSLWQLRDEIASRLALFKPSFVGPGTIWALLLLVVAMGIAAVTAVIRMGDDDGGPARLRRVVIGCGAFAVANSGVWALLTPPFQVPDEMMHVEYAAYLRHERALPNIYASDDERNFAEPLHDDYQSLIRVMPFSVEGRPSWSRADDAELRKRLARPLPPDPRGARSAAGSEPLYYGLVALATWPASRLDAIDELYVMRLLSGLLAGLTASLTTLFLAEVFRRVSRAVLVGGLAVGGHPVVAFLGGGVNNDNLLLVMSSLLFLLLARGFRRGLTLRLALAIGITLGLGCLTKTRFLFLLPPSALGLLLLALRSQGALVPRVARLATGLSVPVVAQLGWMYLAPRLVRVVGESTAQLGSGDTSLRGAASYVWQSYLPRLPFMSDDFPHWPQYVLWDVHVQGFIGRFGWFQYDFPTEVELLGAGVLAAIAGLAAWSLWRYRSNVRQRLGETVTYAAMATGLLVFLAIASYDYRARTSFNLEQTRYLFPCLPLYGLAVALAVRGLRQAWQRPVSAGMVTIISTHSFGAMVLTLLRYYT